MADGEPVEFQVRSSVFRTDFELRSMQGAAFLVNEIAVHRFAGARFAAHLPGGIPLVMSASTRISEVGAVDNDSVR